MATGKCVCCGRPATNRLTLRNRGERSAFLCDFHYNDMHSYSTENNKRRGCEKVNGFTYSIEFETSYSTEKGRVEIMSLGFIPTFDITVDCEYKSPIYNGLNAPIKQCVSIFDLLINGNIRIDSDCGTHFHVGHSEHINPQTMRYLRRFFNSLFVPLSDAIAADPEKARKFWGRNFVHYASPITNDSTSGNLDGDEMPHTTFVNLQHDYTIEFRLCKFVSAQQYQNVMRFCKDVVSCIINNFILHFNATDYNDSKFESITAYRKHQAEKTARKIVMLYNKYTMGL